MRFIIIYEYCYFCNADSPDLHMHVRRNTTGMKQKVLLLCMLFISGLYVQAHQFEREKTIDKRFNATSKTEISISSKYGNIHVKNWDQAAVKFDINVKVKGVNVDKVNKIPM